MKLLYDKNNLPDARQAARHSLRLVALSGVVDLSEASPAEPAFLFAYERGDEHYRRLVEHRSFVLDRPEERYELIRLDDILRRLAEREIDLPQPRTWIIDVDDAPPADLEFPLFVRTPKSSWKRGGGQARVNNLRQLSDEAELLRRAFGWDTPILCAAMDQRRCRGNVHVRRRSARDSRLDRRASPNCLVVSLSPRGAKAAGFSAVSGRSPAALQIRRPSRRRVRR